MSNIPVKYSQTVYKRMNEFQHNTTYLPNCLMKKGKGREGKGEIIRIN